MQNKKIMKFLCFKLHIPYNSINYHKLCKRVHLLPLKERRNISDITFVFKIASNQVDCPELLRKINLNVTSMCIRYNPLLHIPIVSTNYKQN